MTLGKECKRSQNRRAAELYRTRVLDGQFDMVGSCPCDDSAGVLGAGDRNTIWWCAPLATRFTRDGLRIRIVQCTAVIVTATLPVGPEER